jgi:hypothetical protein
VPDDAGVQSPGDENQLTGTGAPIKPIPVFRTGIGASKQKKLIAIASRYRSGSKNGPK